MVFPGLRRSGGREWLLVPAPPDAVTGSEPTPTLSFSPPSAKFRKYYHLSLLIYKVNQRI